MSWWQRRGLRFKMTLAVSLTLVLVLGAIVLAATAYFRSVMRGQEEANARQVTSAFLATIRGQMLVNDWDRVQVDADLLGEAQQGWLDDVAIITRRQDTGATAVGRTTLLVFATGFPGGRTISRGALEVDDQAAGCVECHAASAQQLPDRAFLVVEGEEVLRTARGIVNEPACRSCHTNDRATVGVVLIDLSLNGFRQTSRVTTAVLGGGGAVAILLALAALYLLMHRLVVRPLHRMVFSTQAIARGDWDQRMPAGSGDEVGTLGAAFSEMAGRLAGTYTTLQQTLAEREEETAALQQALDEVSLSHEQQTRLLQTIREISTPVIPVQQGVLVMPLVGIIDSQRAESITDGLLAAIEREHARVVILDITGVPMVDTAVAQALLQAARAARLLGADPVLVGISPQVAQTIVALGVDLADLLTQADLQSGLAFALRLKPARMRERREEP